MPNRVFVNLPVTGAPRATAFYEAIGRTFIEPDAHIFEPLHMGMPAAAMAQAEPA
ncbi:hypothetical protein [Sphingomonas sp. TDK1]|uniref:hypothetical protein n=1 Tax=Sphingomonas sp. TDK1 TaxID=453247 RepID=UPI000A4E366C|nr:hypothetical protein [Sphingomonas sp. TDK1]